MLGKVKRGKQSETLRQFELFLKKRNENNFILQSETEPIQTKVKCFEELFRLTRAGTPLHFHSPPPEEPPRSKSSQNHIPQTPQPFAEIEENTEFVAGKFNKMAHELKSWEVSKQTSTHYETGKLGGKERKDCQLPSRREMKAKKMHSSSGNVSRPFKEEGESKGEESRCLLGSESRPEYCRMRKKNRAYMSRYFNTKKSHNYNASSPSLNIEIKQQNFQNLKKKIKDLQTKANDCFGIKFQCSREPEEEDFEDFDAPQKLELARAIATADGRRNNCHQNYNKLVKQHTKEDSSIPSKFLGFIRSHESKSRPFTQGGCSRRYIRV